MFIMTDLRKKMSCKAESSSASYQLLNIKKAMKQIQGNKKGAFTLTEIIVVIVIIAALALILIPNMLKMMPDDHNIKYKKAFYAIQEIVNDIATSECQGLVSAEGGAWNAANNPENVLNYCYNENDNSSKALTMQICNRLNTTGVCGTAPLNNATTMFGVLTTDGMRWNLMGGQSIGNGDAAAWNYTIYVDVDGCGNDTDVNYNTQFNNVNGATCVNNGTSPANGVYGITISSTGKVTPAASADNNETTLLFGKPTD